MNKQEIEHQIKRYETVRECAEEHLNELNTQLRDLCEAEKPKLGHGDFGTFKNGSPRIIVKEKVYNDVGICGHTDNVDFYDIFGNIFDLMKNWGKDLTEFELDVNKYFIDERADMSHAPIHIAGNWHTEAEAYKFWCDFGQMLMTLKRKQQK